MTFTASCNAYLKNLQQTSANPEATSELSLRPHLDVLLQDAIALFAPGLQAVGEARANEWGRPDYVLTQNGLPVGYVEAEKPSADLRHLSGHAKEQNQRFAANLDRFLLTNHYHFQLFENGECVAEAHLPQSASRVSAAQTQPLEDLLERFLQSEPLSVATAKELALHLARRTRQMAFQAELSLQDENSSLQNDLIAFREVLLPDLPADEFADLYAQTIAYGLFAARCEFHGAKSTFTRMAAAEAVPKTNPFLRAMFQRLGVFDLEPAIQWIIDDMTAVLANADMANVLEDFQKQSGREDPVVHFYETFLAAYDPALREVRGVYYTPEPVVSYIVRSVHLLLQSHFGFDTGLAHEKALILDPATGTGSFLFETVRQIEQQVRRQAGASAWKSYVKDHLLGRLFGFELLAAPYAVAHLKLALQLENSGY